MLRNKRLRIQLEPNLEWRHDGCNRFVICVSCICLLCLSILGQSVRARRVYIKDTGAMALHGALWVKDGVPAGQPHGCRGHHGTRIK